MFDGKTVRFVRDSRANVAALSYVAVIAAEESQLIANLPVFAEGNLHLVSNIVDSHYTIVPRVLQLEFQLCMKQIDLLF